MVVGFTMTSASDIAGSSIGKPPACNTPRFTSSARWRRCVWQGLISLQVLMIAITGRPAQSAVSYPTWRRRERWPNERRSLTPSQRWLRRSSGRLRLVMTVWCSNAGGLVELHVGRLDDPRPLLGFLGDQLAEILRAAKDQHAAELGEPRFHRA